MIEIILTVIVYLTGAITEYESKGKITNVIYYSDVNSSKECIKKDKVL